MIHEIDEINSFIGNMELLGVHGDRKKFTWFSFGWRRNE